MAPPKATKRVHNNMWKAVEDRATTARSTFDFETLTFIHQGCDEEEQSNNYDDAELEEEEESSSLPFHPDDYSNKLSLQPSERLTQQLLRQRFSNSCGDGDHHHHSNVRGSYRTSPMNRTCSSNDPEMYLDKLATQDMKLVGRDAEIQLLEKLYQNAISSTSSSSQQHQQQQLENPRDMMKKKMVVVVGPSGSGKSALGMHLKESSLHQNGGGIWCAGKFDQQNQSDPYEAIAVAISSLIRNSNEALLEEWKHVISRTLGEELDILIELVPAISVLLKQDGGGERSTDDKVVVLGESAAAEQARSDVSIATSTSKSKHSVVPLGADRSITEKATRIQNVLVEFLRLVSTEDHPITMLLDDIQWASYSALALIDALVVDQTVKHVFLLATCRQEYLLPPNSATTDSDHDTATASTKGGAAMSTAQQFLERRSNQIHKMVIGGLDVEGVQQMINTLLRTHVPEPNTRALAKLVHQKCNGNPFFVLQLMSLLYEQGLLTYDWSSFSWNWLEGDVQSQRIATNVTDVTDAVKTRLKTLSMQDQLILQVAACIGASFERHMMEFVLAGLHAKYEREWEEISAWPQGGLKKNLDTLRDLGILEKQYDFGKYSFVHDQVQASAFVLIPDSRKIIIQAAIGQRLIEGLDEKHRDQFLFTAVQLWGVRVPNMTEAEKKQYAFWAFLAGDTALKQGAFDSALGFLNSAIECLGDNPFQTDPQLALPLFSGAAEASYCINDKKVMEYVNVVQRQSSVAKSDMMRVSIIELKVLSNNRDFRGCVDAFRRICKDLGAAKFSKKPGILSLLYQVVITTRLLKRYDREKFLQLPACTDPNIVGALRAENVCFAQLYMSNPNLCVVATCQAVQWTIRYGHSKSSAPALVSMAMMLIGISGSYNLAYEVGEIALELCNVYMYKETLPPTVALVFGYVRHWVKPMHDFVAPMRYAMDLGMRMGNMDDCGLLFSTFGVMLLLCQIDTLVSAITEIERYRRIMIEKNVKDHLVFTEVNLAFAHKMAYDENDDCGSLNGEIMKEEDMFALAEENEDKILTAFIYYQKMMLNVYFGKHVDAAKFAAKNADVGFNICQGCHFVPRNTFFVGLSMVLAHRVDGRATRLKTANLMKKRLKAWLKSGNPNVLHFLHLLRAELKYSQQKFSEARIEYINATKVSTRTGFKLDFALSNELLSRFYADAVNPLRDLSQSRHHMEAAIESYSAYGAANKVRYLKMQHPDILPQQ